MSKFKLRKWQEEAGDNAFTAFRSGQDVWVTEACTGGGKTMHGVDVARRLINSAVVDLVIVVTPSTATKSGWVHSFAKGSLNATDDPDLFGTSDFNALVISYGGITRLEAALYHRPVYKGIFVIVDEYHHAEEDAAWGATVALLCQKATKSLFLSGTPWRSSGQIAVLASHKNINGTPYYNGDRVEADYKYQYAEDLAQPDDIDRATVAVEFAFQDSQYTSPDGRVEELKNPHLSNMPDQEREQWIAEAMQSDIRVGKHVRTQFNGIDYSLSANPLVRDLLQLGCDKLDRHRTRARSMIPVLLVVAQSIKEARAIHQYLLDVKGLRSALIVSDKDTASHELTEIQDRCQKGLLDVIVSVGMVSEGVDIPQIKGIVFLSGIMTLLYIIQVIGRLLRRIRVGDGYMDASTNHLPGFFVAPSAPKLLACAYRIEQEISEAGRRTGTPGGGGGGDDTTPEPEVEQGIISTDGDREHIYRGSEDHADWQRVVETMLGHERAEQCHVDRFWAEWILSMILGGNKTAWEEARRQAEDRCKCLGISLGEMLNSAVEVSGTTLTMAQQHKLASREAEAIRAKLRWGASPYKDSENSEWAYKAVNTDVNKRAGLRGSFTSASIENKRRWIATAEKMYAERVAA
jgi:superfamily II DNA or RNA helicase